MYQPVMATTVVYMQKLLGRKAARQGEERSAQLQPASVGHKSCSGWENRYNQPEGTAHKGKLPNISSFLRTKQVQGRKAKSI